MCFFLFSSAYSCAFCTVNNKSYPQKLLPIYYNAESAIWLL